MSNERTLSIIKPDAVAKNVIGEIYTRFEKADLTIKFKDSMTGVKLLTKGSLPAFMTAVQEGKLSIEGDYSLMMWFNKLAKHIVPTIPEECEPYINKAKPYAYKAQQFAQHWVGVAKHKLGK